MAPFIQAADKESLSKTDGHGFTVKQATQRTALVEHYPPDKLSSILNLRLPNEGAGKDGMLDLIQKILRYSVNTWDQGSPPPIASCGLMLSFDRFHG